MIHDLELLMNEDYARRVRSQTRSNRHFGFNPYLIMLRQGVSLRARRRFATTSFGGKGTARPAEGSMILLLVG